MTVRQLLDQVDSAELTEWFAYAQLEPFGEVIADRRHGIATALLANVNRNEKKRPDPFNEVDFVPWRKRKQEEAGPVLLDDPEAQSRLLTQVFKSG